MERRIGISLAVAAALVVLAAAPLRAFGVIGQGTAGLVVSASLGGCGVASGDGGVACRIDVGYGGVAGADRYTASATLPDGSVQDFGTLGGAGNSSVYVPYVGAGTYTVTVSAWGPPVAPGKDAKLIEREGAPAEG